MAEMQSPDYKELLLELNAHDVVFMIVGAHALAVHGHARATKDLDVWVRPDPENARRILQALRSFGAPLYELNEEELSKPGLIFQIGATGVRIDVITEIDGVEFGEAWNERVSGRLFEQPVHVPSKTHMIKNKRASGRTQDLADVEALEALD